MSDDLPLEESTREVSAPSRVRRGEHVWEQHSSWWELYFAVVLVATEVFVGFSPEPSGTVRGFACGMLLLCLPLYLGAGRPALLTRPENSVRGTVYIVGLVVLFTPAATVASSTTLAVFALAPQCFLLLSMGRAVTAVFVLNLAPLLGWALVTSPGSGEIVRISMFTATSVAFSWGIGTWIQRIIDQSVERGQLIQRLNESREEISRLSAAHGALGERERLAREIHDTLAQGFSSLVMLSQAVRTEFVQAPERATQHLELLERTARENLDESRALVAALTPAQLDGRSLQDAVRRLGERLAAEDAGRTVSVDIGGTARRLPASVEVVALRSCQEGLANVRKHAAARRVELRLDYGTDAVRITLRDDGHGFDVNGQSHGYGLAGLRARVQEIGGVTRVRSAPGQGTELLLTLPMTHGAPGVGLGADIGAEGGDETGSEAAAEDVPEGPNSSAQRKRGKEATR